MSTLAVLPVKRFELAKQRLSADLEPAVRRRLAEAMVSDVLAALTVCGSIDATLVVTNEPRVLELAADCGARTARDPEESGQSAAAQVGIQLALAEDFKRVLLVPGDCPALDPAELDELLGADAGAAPNVVIVPDRHRTGTNALLLDPPDAIAPTFGPGSFRRHRDRAFAVGAEAQVRELASLLLDVDTPRDLEALREALDARAGHASRTRAVLSGLP
ncbi:MAG: 2-phospho-L-lactate guanylyltransferase [Solirubrobacteraceae bacterium]